MLTSFSVYSVRPVKMKTLLGLLSLLLIFAVSCGEEDSARLLASKNVLNQLLVEGKDLTVEYVIYNVGGSTAHKVNLRDDSFPEDYFERVQGFLDVTWQRIAPGSNVSHVVILRPLKAGYFNFTSAEVSYFPREDTTDAQFGYTSAPGEGGIMNFRDYDRKFSPHVLDWTAFAVMTLPSLGMPLFLWYRSKSNYESSKVKKS